MFKMLLRTMTILVSITRDTNVDTIEIKELDVIKKGTVKIGRFLGLIV